MKFGYVSIIGRPNVGKSTLLNGLLGTKVSIVSDKPQTTRHRVLGVRTEKEYQIVFVDTPGIHRPGFRLNERMMAEVYDSIREVDLVLHLVDASQSYGKGEQFVVEMMKAAEPRKFLLLNKVDLVNKGKLLPKIEFYNEQGIYDEIIPLSALTGENVDVLTAEMLRYLNDGDPLFPPDYLTNLNERQMVGEIVREKVLAHTRKELPYSSAVVVEEFDESRREEGFVRIRASILVEKDGQKKIVIGRAGQMIKQIGIEARKDIEELLEVGRIYLELNVKVEPGWRNRGPLLDDLGLTLT